MIVKHCIELNSLRSTQQFGRVLGDLAKPGDVYCFDGDLGVGKTTIIQEVAKSIGVPEEYYVTSPTYNIFHEYPGKIPLFHMDFYRLNGIDDIIDMGLDEYFYASGLTAIEWSEKANDILPKNSLGIFLTRSTQQSRIAVCSCLVDHFGQDRFQMLIDAVSG